MEIVSENKMMTLGSDAAFCEKELIKGPDNPTSQLLPIIRNRG